MTAVAATRSKAGRVVGVTLLTVAQAVAALAAVVYFLGVGPISADNPSLPLVLLVVLFAATEVMVVHIEARGGAYTLSFGEAPLVLGLALAGPSSLIVGRLAGAGLSLAVHRRQAPSKLAFNLAMFGAETALAVTVYRIVLDGGGVLSLRGVTAALTATLAANTFSAVAVTAVIWVSTSRRPPLDAIRRVVGASWATGLANAALGIGLLASLIYNLWLFLPLLGTMGVLFLLYRAYIRLNERYRSLATLHEFAKRASGSLELGVAASTVLQSARELLRAHRADLVLLGADGGDATWVSAGPGGVDINRLGDEDTRQQLAHLLTASGAHIVDGSQLPPVLDAASAKKAVVSPVVGDHGLQGMAFAIDRDSAVSDFDAEDVTLFETLANTASVSLQKSALFARLQDEAADRLHQALHDSLTGLPNRQALEEGLVEALAEARDRNQRLAVVLIDLDGFKEINDTLGHQAGDLVLRALSQRLADRTPPGGTIARLGGDEFVLLLPEIADADEAVRLAAPLTEALDAPVHHGELTLTVGARMGVALYPEHGTDGMTLLQRADVAMYDARASMTSCEVYTPERDPFTPQRLAIVGQLREALGRREIEVWFQPQQDLTTGLVTGAEALVRWRHPTRGIIEPAEFLPFSERSGLIRPLALHVLATAVERCRAWRADGFDLAVAVNLSVRNLIDPELAVAVFDLLSAAQLPPDVLKVEVTESGIMADSRRAVAALNQLHNLGVRLSIDDFGTGYSSLTRLRDLPLTELKIDRSFVVNATTEPEDAAIVTSTIDLAHRLGLRVVAEGVESADTVAWLNSIGCDSFQGYFLTRPLPAEAFSRWLHDHDTARFPV